MSQTTDIRTMRRSAQSTNRLVLTSAVLTQLMIILDLTVIAVALPQMQQQLEMASSQSPWIVTAYALAFGGLVLFGGTLSAALGLRRAYLIGLGGFAISSLIAGLAPSFAVLVAGRAAQGVFAALLAPTLLALVNQAFGEVAGRNRAFAILGATGGTGAAIGLLLGGALTEYMNWRWTLFINVFIAFFAALVSLRSISAHGAGSSAVKMNRDFLGLLLGCSAIFSLVFGFDRAQQDSWTSASALTWFIAGGLLLATFLLRERYAKDPAIPGWLVFSRTRGSAYLTQFFVGTGQMGAFIYLTYYFQNHFEYSPMRAGVTFLPLVAALIVTALISGRTLAPKYGARLLFPAGLLVQAAALLILSRITVDSSYVEVALPGIIVFGIGLGLSMPMVFNAGTANVNSAFSGRASALVQASQQIGSSFGVAILSSYAATSIRDYVAGNREGAQAQVLEQLAAAGKDPMSAEGQGIAAKAMESFQDAAQLNAYSGGFLLMGVIISVAALVVCAVLFLGSPTRSKEE
ncbi:MFS transporter [Scrofimicrobium canadense]|uniref:MFS transporter n=1 Tax=Scrofimicrobium canadense TaxID=2652290 RepID=UPI001CED0BAA|nr:MFS transporter [Scrofimicrobium canadense]